MTLTSVKPSYIHPLLQQEYDLLKDQNHEFWWHSDGLYMQARWRNNWRHHYSYTIREDGTLFCTKL
jgi:hypothetical protein